MTRDRRVTRSVIYSTGKSASHYIQYCDTTWHGPMLKVHYYLPVPRPNPAQSIRVARADFDPVLP
eukprot:6176414-Pleurochrysis_carterae.AAC.2